MTLKEKVRQVEKVFQHLEGATAQFKKESGLFCKSSCGACCRKPDIHAMPLEFLPFAYHLYKSGQSDQFLEQIVSAPDSICVLFSSLSLHPMAGSCTQYAHRGLICRLFGYAAAIDKNGIRQISTCKIIKEEQSTQYLRASEKVQQREMAIPVMRDYYMQLSAIDMNLSRESLPINQAIQKAIEHVEFYFYMKGGNRAS